MTKSQAEVITDLLTRRDAVLTQLAGLTSTSIGALPNSAGTGDSLDHVGLRRSLYQELADIDAALERIAGPRESISKGRLT